MHLISFKDYLTKQQIVAIEASFVPPKHSIIKIAGKSYMVSEEPVLRVSLPDRGIRGELDYVEVFIGELNDK
jgi:hypothetical protein